MVFTRSSRPSWVSAAAARVDFDGNVSSMSEAMFAEGRETSPLQRQQTDFNLGFAERSFSAAGAAVLSVVLVNPLDVAKTRLQAQAAGVPYASPGDLCRSRMTSLGPNAMLSDLRCSEAVCPPDCFRYKGTMDVFNKIIQQEGVGRLWRGTSAGLALAIPTVGIYLPCYDIFRNWIEEITNRRAPYLTPYVPLVAGSMARSLACFACYPIELAKTRMQAFKDIQVGVKPPGVRQTLLGVLTSFRSSNNVQNSTASCGLELELNLLVMFLFLLFAGQHLSRFEEGFLVWWVMKQMQPVLLVPIFLLVLSQEASLLLLRVP